MFCGTIMLLHLGCPPHPGWSTFNPTPPSPNSTPVTSPISLHNVAVSLPARLKLYPQINNRKTPFLCDLCIKMDFRTGSTLVFNLDWCYTFPHHAIKGLFAVLLEKKHERESGTHITLGSGEINDRQSSRAACQPQKDQKSNLTARLIAS